MFRKDDARGPSLLSPGKPRCITSAWNLDNHGIPGTVLLVILHQLAAQASGHDADNRIFLGVVGSSTFKDFNPDHGFFQLVRPAG